MNQKNMFWTYTILAALCGVGVIVFSTLATYADKKKDISEESPNNPIFNIEGDYINGDKTVKEKSTPAVIHTEKIIEHKPAIVNNGGIVNSGNNYGSQTVNNYNEKQPRKLNTTDINEIKNAIPKDYAVIISFINSTEETINYTKEIISELKKLDYNIIETNSIGILAGGKPYVQGERYYIELDNSNKKAEIIIREQK
jgi:hypothetical protein